MDLNVKVLRDEVDEKLASYEKDRKEAVEKLLPVARHVAHVLRLPEIREGIEIRWEIDGSDLLLVLSHVDGFPEVREVVDTLVEEFGPARVSDSPELRRRALRWKATGYRSFILRIVIGAESKECKVINTGEFSSFSSPKRKFVCVGDPDFPIEKEEDREEAIAV